MSSNSIPLAKEHIIKEMLTELANETKTNEQTKQEAGVIPEPEAVKEEEKKNWEPDISTQMPSTLRSVSFRTGTFERTYGYGHTTRDIYIVDQDTGKVYDPRKEKALFINGEYKDNVSRHYAVIPDEKIEALMEPAMKHHHLKQLTKEKTFNGLGTCWRLLSEDKSFTIKSKTPDDIYQVGLVVKNSVNGGIALSLNVETYRQICGNGMMGWRPEMGLRLAHYGEMEEKLAMFSEQFDKALARYEEIEDILQKAVPIVMTKQLAQFFVTDTTITRNWLPDFIQTDDKYKVTGLKGTEHTLYETLNDVTWKLTRSRIDHPEHKQVDAQIGFLKRTELEKKLGKTVELIVKAKGQVPQSRKKSRG